MNKNLTDITVIIDKSGSMSPIRHDTIGGFNRFLEDQKKQPGEAKLTLVQFDDQYEVHLNAVDLKYVSPLTPETYMPRGSTALLDAMGKTIDRAGRRLAAIPENERPGQVLFVIITDGQENASREFKGPNGKKAIFEKVTHQQEKYNWTFLFLGANQDAIQVGADYGFLANNSLTYATNKAAVDNAFSTVSMASTLTRSGLYTGFTEEDRLNAVVDDKTNTASSTK
jgi:hypothetical protein